MLPAAAQADAALAAVAQRSHVELRAVMFSRHSQAPSTVRTRVGELRAAGGTVRFVAEDSRSQQDGQQDEVCVGAAELLLNQEQAAPPAMHRAWRRWAGSLAARERFELPVLSFACPVVRLDRAQQAAVCLLPDRGVCEYLQALHTLWPPGCELQPRMPRMLNTRGVRE